MSVITIVGAGVMGSAMSIPAADNGHEVRLVGTPLDREIIERLSTDGVHPKHQRKLPETVRFLQIEELTRAIAGADLLINGVSSFGVDWFTQQCSAGHPRRSAGAFRNERIGGSGRSAHSVPL